MHETAKPFKLSFFFKNTSLEPQQLSKNHYVGLYLQMFF